MPESVSQTGRTILHLRELLLRGEFRPGERISELPLVAMLGVSRTPIRLALERLAHEGLLEPNPTGGFIVRSFTLDDVWDSIQMRGTLEGMAARLAAERLTDDRELDALRKCQQEMDGLGLAPTSETFPLYLELNEAFHAEILRLAKSPMLKLMLDRLLCLPFASPSALVTSPLKLADSSHRFRVGSEHHNLLIDAIARR